MKHNGLEQRGWVTAILLVGEKEACRLDECTANSQRFTRVPPKFTDSRKFLPVFTGKIPKKNLKLNLENG